MKAMESAWFRFEEEAEHMEAASTATTLLRRSSRLSTEVRHRTEERCFSTLGSATSSPFFFRGSGAGGGLGGGRFEMQARVRRDEAGPLTSPVGGGRVTGVGGEGGVVGGSGRFPAFPRGVDAAADIASRRTEFAQRFGMFTRPNAKEPANLSSANELDEVKKDLRNAREENLKLQAVITDVTEVNKRWQKYNNDRQMYVDKLLSTIQNQQEQMNTNIEKRLQMSKEGDDCIDLTRQLHAENAKLRDEVGQLKRRMESMEREHKEHVEVLEIQVKANKDDWEAEKREKELARQEKEKLEKLAQELQEEINLLKLKYSCHHSTMGQRRPSSCGSAGCHFIYGEDGRESHCSSHITICRKNSFPAHRTSMHVPCASGHLIPRGSLVYLDDDLVIDGDSEKIKPALELNVPIQLRSRSNSMEDIMSPPNEEKKPFSESEVKGDLNRFKDSAAESVEKCVLDIPSTNGVTQSRSASTFSSASSLSLASGGCRLEGSLLNIKDMAASSSSNSLVSSSAKALPPLPTSYSDTVVPDQVHKPALDSRWSTRISASPFKININNLEATNVVDVNLQSSSTMLPNIAAEPSFEECPEDGVLTQTREDVICPGCGRVFHPEIHLQFLKHFGECQSKNKANKSTLKSRN